MFLIEATTVTAVVALVVALVDAAVVAMVITAVVAMVIMAVVIIFPSISFMALFNISSIDWETYCSTTMPSSSPLAVGRQRGCKAL